MRILAGQYARKQIFLPDEKVTRPTSNKVKEALFTILSNHMDLEETVVLDAFAGSGALGLEALSRGAAKSYFFEQNPKAYAVIKKNICLLKVETKSILIRCDCMMIRTAPEPCNIVFLDPPYGKNLIQKSLANLTKNNWIDSETHCVIEYSTREILDTTDLKLITQKTYGDTSLILCKVNF